MTVQVGDRVRVPWGYSDFVDGRVTQIWGDPPTHIRVLLDFGTFDDGSPDLQELLLSPDVIEPAA
jgi:hypothetical protein